MAFGTLIDLSFIEIWLVAAIYIDNKNAQLTRDNQIINELSIFKPQFIVLIRLILLTRSLQIVF